MCFVVIIVAVFVRVHLVKSDP